MTDIDETLVGRRVYIREIPVKREPCSDGLGMVDSVEQKGWGVVVITLSNNDISDSLTFVGRSDGRDLEVTPS